MLKVEITCDYCGKKIDPKSARYLLGIIVDNKVRLANPSEVKTLVPRLDLKRNSPVIIEEHFEKEIHLCPICLEKLEALLKEKPK